jgi:protein translocase, SecG subunit
MLVGLLTALLIIDGLLLVLFILIQKGKGDMGLGALGGGAQTLFGGSGGQDLFQKITWVLAAIFMAGSLGLSVLKSKGNVFGDVVSRSSRTSVPMPRPSDSVPQSNPANQEDTVSQIPSGDTKPGQ